MTALERLQFNFELTDTHLNGLCRDYRQEDYLTHIQHAVDIYPELDPQKINFDSVTDDLRAYNEIIRIISEHLGVTAAEKESNAYYKLDQEAKDKIKFLTTIFKELLSKLKNKEISPYYKDIIEEANQYILSAEIFTI